MRQLRECIRREHYSEDRKAFAARMRREGFRSFNRAAVRVSLMGSRSCLNLLAHGECRAARCVRWLVGRRGVVIRGGSQFCQVRFLVDRQRRSSGARGSLSFGAADGRSRRDHECRSEQVAESHGTAPFRTHLPEFAQFIGRSVARARQGSAQNTITRACRSVYLRTLFKVYRNNRHCVNRLFSKRAAKRSKTVRQSPVARPNPASRASPNPRRPPAPARGKFATRPRRDVCWKSFHRRAMARGRWDPSAIRARLLALPRQFAGVPPVTSRVATLQSVTGI